MQCVYRFCISYSLAGCAFYKLLRLDYTHKQAVRALKFLAVFPASFFFSGPMSESLFLLTAILCIYCIRTQKWLLGGLFGGYAAFTRSIGITLLVVLFIEYIREYFVCEKSEIERTNIFKKFLFGFMVISGFGVYCCINYMVSGNFFKFAEYQKKHWGQGLGWFFDTVAYQTDLFVKNLEQNPVMSWGLWLPNLVMIALSLIIMLFAVKKLRPSYTAWFIAYFIIAIGATWLLSAPRYLVAYFPLAIALMLITENIKTDVPVTFCLAVLNITYLCLFSLRWYVW